MKNDRANQTKVLGACITRIAPVCLKAHRRAATAGTFSLRAEVRAEVRDGVPAAGPGRDWFILPSGIDFATCTMRSLPSFLLCVVLCSAGWQSAQASELCAPLPSSVQNVSVSYISESAELQKLDELLESHLQPCLQPPTPQNTKALCSHGRVLGEQVLRVVGRIDEAGKKNAFLSNVKMKSYKTASALLERMKKLSADKVCP